MRFFSQQKPSGDADVAHLAGCQYSVIDVSQSLGVTTVAWQDDAQAVRHVDKIRCTSLVDIMVNISHGKNEVFSCFILAGSTARFLSTGKLSSSVKCLCFFFAFLKLVAPAPTEYCLYLVRFSMQWTWMWASLRTTPPGATKVSECFWKRLFISAGTGNKPIERRLEFSLGSPKNGYKVVFIILAALNEMFSPGTLPLTRIGAVLGNKPLLARRRWVGWIRDASVIKNMGNVSKLFFLAPVKLTNQFEQTFLDRVWEGCRGGKQNPKFETQIFRGIDPGVILVYILGNSTHPVCWFQSWTMWWFQRFFLFTPKPWEDFTQFAHIFFIPGLKVETNHQTLNEILLGNSGQEHLTSPPSRHGTHDFSWLASHRGKNFPCRRSIWSLPTLTANLKKLPRLGFDSTGLGLRYTTVPKS